MRQLIDWVIENYTYDNGYWTAIDPEVDDGAITSDDLVLIYNKLIGDLTPDYKELYYKGIESNFKQTEQSFKDTVEHFNLETKYLQALKKIQSLSPEYDVKLDEEIGALIEKVNSRNKAVDEVTSMIDGLMDEIN